MSIENEKPDNREDIQCTDIDDVVFVPDEYLRAIEKVLHDWEEFKRVAGLRGEK
jgi:hypothetical protein